MLKTLGNTLLALLMIHLLAAVGGAVWLYGTDRLDSHRAKAIWAMLKTTITEAKAQEVRAKQLEEQTHQQAENQARILALGKGPVIAQDHLAQQERDTEVFQQQMDRMERDKQDLMRQIQVAKDMLSKQKLEFDAERKAFEKALAEEKAQRNSRDFQQAVQMYEQIKPKQVKDMFQDLMRRNQTDQVVEYLAAMQLRKAAAVLKEFKTPEDVAQATDLVQRLRSRGVDVLGSLGTPSGVPNAGTPGTTPGTATQPSGAS